MIHTAGNRTRRTRRLSETASRIVRTLDFREPSWARPLPRVRIRTRRWVPAWVAHVLAAAIAVGCIATVATTRSEWAIPSVLVALMLLRPAGAPPALLALWLGLQVTTSEVSAHSLKASGLVLGLHLLAVVLVTAGDVRPRTRVELRVFAGPVRRLAAIQVFVQPVTWATMTLAARDVTVRWLPILAALCVVVASWMLIRQVARTSDQSPTPTDL